MPSSAARFDLLPPLALHVRIEELPETYQEVAGVIGMAAALHLARLFGGCPLHIPKLDRLLVPARDRRIHAEYDGANSAALARRYSLSKRHVQTILAKQESTS